MRPTSVARALQGLIPPKIATPSSVSSGASSARTENVVAFYKSLPKGPSEHKAGGLRGRYFEGKNASG
ncbi:hypothetical protein FFLO_00988 [Filobasidium floriforme]|uniref:Uncharacterized protein n=2 Tax=Filobasidium floriforme TaxID=5210 RepID=A0A8K0JRD5_9TREE|nr:hypothetical protein FFLO_00988 [Filobasidium floriforme]